MSDLKLQALRLMLSLDSLLEPFEDTFENVTIASEKIRYGKLRRLMKRAEIRYYRRTQKSPSPWSLVTAIAAKVEPEPVAATATPYAAWTSPYMD